MTGTGTGGLGIGGTLRLTWVTDHLAHVIDTCTAGDTSTAWETSGTWTGLAGPDHGLAIGSDVDNATFRLLAGRDQLADLVWATAGVPVPDTPGEVQ
jgi:hypothetical protein